MPIIPIVPPVILPLPLPLKARKRRERRIRERLPRRNALLSEGFVGKILQLGRIDKITKKQAIKRVRLGVAPLGIRGIPIVIPDVPKRRRR